MFINEIHYDNVGTDSGEAIEIAGPAGTDLSGWSIVLYNGNGGAVYDTEVLSGTIDDEGAGYGALRYAATGIQNGAPDAIALVEGTTVRQFLSYEGAFVGVGGAASGLTSTDIDVEQSGNGAIGLSLQLGGTGTTYGDFSWPRRPPPASARSTPDSPSAEATTVPLPSSPRRRPMAPPVSPRMPRSRSRSQSP